MATEFIFWSQKSNDPLDLYFHGILPLALLGLDRSVDKAVSTQKTVRFCTPLLVGAGNMVRGQLAH